jgi:hypothetical protein
MSYATVANVVAMFPGFIRNGPKGPADALIQTFIDDTTAEIDAVLQGRFSEAITGSLSGTFAGWSAAFSLDQKNLLEKICRFGACAEMGTVFEAFGIVTFAKLAAEYEKKYQALVNALNERDGSGKLLAEGGRYDSLFDPLSTIESPRPMMGGAAGADQQRQTLDDEGMFSKFGRDDPRGK